MFVIALLATTLHNFIINFFKIGKAALRRFIICLLLLDRAFVFISTQ